MRGNILKLIIIVGCLAAFSTGIAIAAGVPSTASTDTQVTLTVEETATFLVNGAVPRSMVYFAKSWSGREYAKPGLTEASNVVFPEVAQTTDALGARMIKFYSGVPSRVTEFQQDKVEIHDPVVLEVSADKVLRNGEPSAISDAAQQVSPGNMIAYSRSERSRGTSTTRIGPAPGHQGLTIGGDASEVEDYKLSQSVEVASYNPNLWVSATSMVPFECDDEGLPNRAIPTAIGVTWEFAKKGMKVEIAGLVLTATKDGGTVQFTKDGPVLKGIAKAKP